MWANRCRCLIDELEQYYAMPFGVAIAPDKSAAYISTTGANSVTVIDITRLLEFIRAASPRERRALGQRLIGIGALRGRAHSGGPRPQGHRAFARWRVAVCRQSAGRHGFRDRHGRAQSGTHDRTRCGPAELTPQRRGERLFFDARFAFHGGFSCANCHIESTFDGLQWDLEPDGFGKDIVDNRLLEDIDGTEPFKWNGGNPDLETECGPRTEKYFYRSQSYSQEELSDIGQLISSRFRRAPTVIACPMAS